MNIGLFALELTDYVGLGLSKEGKLMRHRLNSAKNPVKGVICSDNYSPNDVEQFFLLSCDEVLRDNNKFDISKIKSDMIITV